MLCFAFWMFWPLKMGPVGHPESSVRRCHSRLCDISEECRSHKTVGQCMSWFGSVWSVQSDLVWHFIHELKTPHQLKCQLLRINLVLHLSKCSNILQVHIKHMKRLTLVWLPLTSNPFHSLLWEYRIWFMPSFWGMQMGHKTRPGHCNLRHWRFNSDWSCTCVYWSVSYSTLFQSDLLPHLQSVYSILASALCSWVPCWGTCEHRRTLEWVGVQAVEVGQ